MPWKGSVMSFLSGNSRRGAALLLASLLSAPPIGCRERVEVAPVEVSAPPPVTLRLGLIPEQNLFEQRKRYQLVAGYLSERIGARVELHVLSRYGNILENFASNRLDGAFFGSFTGALAFRKLGVEALARPELLDGTSTYHGLLFVRRDSGIRSAKEMKGKRFAFVDKATTAGFLFPLYYLETQGIADQSSWLGQSYFAGTHEGSIYDVLERRADVGAAKHSVFARLASRDPRIAEQLMILAESPDVPENGLCVRGDLDASLKAKVKETLLNMNRDDEGREILAEFGARRFLVTTEKDYAVVFRFAKKVGLDLASYDYRNE
jgi:phosphonate transport system substrate-binding protein